MPTGSSRPSSMPQAIDFVGADLVPRKSCVGLDADLAVQNVRQSGPAPAASVDHQAVQPGPDPSARGVGQFSVVCRRRGADQLRFPLPDDFPHDNTYPAGHPAGRYFQLAWHHVSQRFVRSANVDPPEPRPAADEDQHSRHIDQDSKVRIRPGRNTNCASRRCLAPSEQDRRGGARIADGDDALVRALDRAGPKPVLRRAGSIGEGVGPSAPPG